MYIKYEVRKEESIRNTKKNPTTLGKNGMVRQTVKHQKINIYDGESNCLQF